MSERCDVCGREFVPEHEYQRVKLRDGVRAVCSSRCVQVLAVTLSSTTQDCETCGSTFVLEHAHQLRTSPGGIHMYCSYECAQVGRTPTVGGSLGQSRLGRIAVFNHKGGTGKTTTSVNLAAAFAEGGKRVLLVDADGQGNVGVSLGVNGPKSLYHVMKYDVPVDQVAVPVRANLDVITSDRTLAAMEVHLAQQGNRHRVLRDRLLRFSEDYEVVIVDCAPSLSLINQNVLAFCDGVLVPVGCDYLSLVGVKQVLRTIRQVREHHGHRVELLGVVPTFFDSRNRMSREAVEVLRKHFGGQCFEPIRVNTRLREAPSERKTIFELDPASHGACDYRALMTQLHREVV